MKRNWAVAILLLLAAPTHAEAQDRFISKITLPSGQTVVVAEGDFEARSIGSFSIRLYEAAADSDETTFFISGLIRARDGVVEKVIYADLDGDKQQEIIVIVRSVGTGNYQSAHAFAITSDEVVFRAAVEGLAPDIDPVAVLQRTENRHR
ncbi:PliI family lysozyme inhibitor of I-type lysozyme [bacterium]|nr:PliI family lysozyme inhibitor of I-type lysozyme [bacterium]